MVCFRTVSEAESSALTCPNVLEIDERASATSGAKIGDCVGGTTRSVDRGTRGFSAKSGERYAHDDLPAILRLQRWNLDFIVLLGLR